MWDTRTLEIASRAGVASASWTVVFAMSELQVAARTDTALLAALEEVPDLATSPGLAEAVMIGLATLRGLPISGFSTGAIPMSCGRSSDPRCALKILPVHARKPLAGNVIQ
jgi:hypothetical protein